MHIIGYTILGIFFAVAILILVLFGRFILLFNHRPCPHCSHSMEYKGEKQHTDGDIYLFYCPKCGAWDEVPKAELDALKKEYMEERPPCMNKECGWFRETGQTNNCAWTVFHDECRDYKE